MKKKLFFTQIGDYVYYTKLIKGTKKKINKLRTEQDENQMNILDKDR